MHHKPLDLYVEGRLSVRCSELMVDLALPTIVMSDKINTKANERFIIGH